jgi:hypothetical protein
VSFQRITTTYQRITARRERVGVCPVCGKRVRRAQTFGNTINPFNKNPDGTVRTAREVRANVERIADEWMPDFTHETCLEESR